MHGSRAGKLLLTGCALALAACGGGGGGGGGTNFIPAPPPAPTPTPPPPSAQAGAWNDTSSSRTFSDIGAHAVYTRDLASTTVQANATLDGSDALTIRYSAADQAYFIDLPGFAEGKIQGDATKPGFYQLVNPSSGAQLGIGITIGDGFTPPTVTTTYTQLGSWRSSTVSGGTETLAEGVFAFGSATPAGGVPIAGSATYAGYASGHVDSAFVRTSENVITPLVIDGPVSMTVNFGSGALTGNMQLELGCGNCFETALGAFNFSGALAAVGSSNFSASFATNLTGANSLIGLFAGPQGQEGMGHFTVPFIDPTTNEQLQMFGAFIIRK